MSRPLIPVEGEQGIYRDPKTDAIVIINSGEQERKKRALKAIKRRERAEIQNLKNEIGEIKDLLKQLLEKS